MFQLLSGKVILVTGAGRGIGRVHALALAEAGASIVVNDVGADVAGGGSNPDVATAVVEKIEKAGGAAVPSRHDVSSWEGAGQAVQTAFDTFGRLDGVLNNAGILRRGDLADMTEDDLDAIFAVHVKGTFGCTAHACRHWREQHERGEGIKASVVQTVSDAMLVALPRYSLYGAAKAAIAHLTTVGSREAAAYGVRINAYGPRAITRMSPKALPDGSEPQLPDDDVWNPRNCSPLLVWLFSDQSAHVTGQVFRTLGGAVARCSPWDPGVLQWPPDGASRFDPEDLGRHLDSTVFGCRFPDLALEQPPA